MSATHVVGLLPAAGRGTRLGLPFPKELFPLFGDGDLTPVMLATIRNMQAVNINEIYVVTNTAKPAIMEYLGDGSRIGTHVAYLCQQQYPGSGKSSGLSEALNCASPFIHDKVVAFGMPDTVVTPEECFGGLLCMVIEDGADLALGLFPTEEPHRFGMVDHEQDGGEVIRVVDKPESSDLHWMWGIAAWSPSFTEHLEETMRAAPADFAGVMNLAIERGLAVRGLRIQGGAYRDLGTQEDLRRMHLENLHDGACV